jgi:hypothetical protein
MPEKKKPQGQRGRSGKDARIGKGHLYRERAGKNTGKSGRFPRRAVQFFIAIISKECYTKSLLKHFNTFMR